jgi:hypothetical protein
MDVVLSIGVPFLILLGIAVYMRYKVSEEVEPPRPGHPGAGGQTTEVEKTDNVSAASTLDPSLQTPSTVISTTQPAPQGNRKQSEDTNFGTIVFALFAALSLMVSLVRGIVPIYLAESALWAGLAWYWYKKKLISPKVNLAVLLIAVFVAAGEGFMVGQQFGGESYTYLKEGNIQFRVNARLGRTDRLWNDGWEPVSFDKPPEVIPSSEILSLVWSMSRGEWDGGILGTPGKICFDFQNNSSYVIRDISLHITLDPKPTDDTSTEFTDVTNLKREVGGLIDKGAEDRVCGDAPRSLPGGTKWSYEVTSAIGWKQ